jgi:hypothetical protein
MPTFLIILLNPLYSEKAHRKPQWQVVHRNYRILCGVGLTKRLVVREMQQASLMQRVVNTLSFKGFCGMTISQVVKRQDCASSELEDETLVAQTHSHPSFSLSLARAAAIPLSSSSSFLRARVCCDIVAGFAVFWTVSAAAAMR